MSADDFQSKYASVMESMLKSAIAETTQLFETMVNELKAEISEIKKENEDLKTRCNQYETAKHHSCKQTTETSLSSEHDAACEKCDTAIQCDLGLCRTVLVEQCAPLRLADLQNQQQRYQQYAKERRHNCLQEHNYVNVKERNPKTPSVRVKQEPLCNDAFLLRNLKEEEIEYPITPVEIQNINEGLKENFVCPPNITNPVIQAYPAEETESTQRNDSDQSVLQQISLGRDTNSRLTESQAGNLQQALVISLKDAFRSCFKEECEVTQKMTETEKQSGYQESPLRSEGLVNDQNKDLAEHTVSQSPEKAPEESLPVNKDVVSEEVKQSTAAEDKACSTSNVGAPRKRGRPPKKTRKRRILTPSDVQRTTNVPQAEKREMENSSLLIENAVSSESSQRAEPLETISIPTQSVDCIQNMHLVDSEKGEIVAPTSAESLSSEVSPNMHTSESHQLSQKMTIDSTKTQTFESSIQGNTLLADSLQTASCQPEITHTSASLQDAMLLVEAMNQSIQNSSDSQPQSTEPLNQRLSPMSKILEVVNGNPIPPQTKSSIAQTALTSKSGDMSLHILANTSTNDVQTHNEVLKLHECNMSKSLITAQKLSPPAIETQTSQQSRLVPTKRTVKKSPQTIIVVPKQNKSISCIGRLTFPQSSQVSLASENNILLQTSHSSSIHSVSESAIKEVCSKSLPDPFPKTASISRRNVPNPQPRITVTISQDETIIIKEPRVIVFKTKVDPTETAAPASSWSASQIDTLDVWKSNEITNATRDNKESPGCQNQETQFSEIQNDPACRDRKTTVGRNQKAHACQNQRTSVCRNRKAPATENQETPVAENQEAPVAENQEAPIAENPDTPVTESIETPVAENQESLVVECTEAPDAKCMVAAGSECTEAANAESTEAPDAECTEAPVMKSMDTADSKSIKTLLIENIETPVSRSGLVINHPTDICSKPSNEQEQTSSALASQPVSKSEYHAVVRLTRLPFSMSAQESISVSRFFKKSFTEGINQKSSSVLEAPTLTCVKIPQFTNEPEKPSTSDETSSSNHPPPSLLSTGPEPIIAESSTPLDLSFGSSKTSESSSSMSKEIANAEEKGSQSSSLLQLTSIRPREQSYPHLRMTQTQFLAQLSVSPIAQERKAIANSSAVFGNTRKRGGKDQQKISIVNRLRSHLKDKLKVRRMSAQEADVEIESIPTSSKMPRLAKDALCDKNVAKIVCDIRPDETRNCSTTNHCFEHGDLVTTSSVSPPTPGKCEFMVTFTERVNQPDFVSPTLETPAPESFEMPIIGGKGVEPNSEGLTFVSPEECTSAEDYSSPEKTSLSLCSPHLNNKGLKSKKSTTTSPQQHSSTKRRSGRTSYRGSLKTKSTSPSPTRSINEDVSPKKSDCLISPKTCALTEHGTSPEISCVLVSSSIKSSPVSYSISTASGISNEARNESVSPNVKGNASTKDGKSAPTKPKRPVGRPPKARVDIVSGVKSTKVAKTKRWGRRKMSKSKQQKLVLDDQPSNKVLKKCRATVWYPPTLPPDEMPLLEMIKPPPVVVEDKIPDIPSNPTPIVSPLQPLAVIGKHLLRNQCGQCGRVFSSSAALESHVRIHTGYRLFACSLCGKVFPDSKTFKRHDRVHRNGRIHICGECGKGFVYRFGLSKHQQVVHSKIRPFICQLCNKGFYSKRDVEIHIRLHTGEKPFKCHLCEKNFKRRVELNVHLRWHNGEKRHWCPFCGKGFLDANNLKRHKYTHTGEKPHHCPLCPKKFSQPSHLKKHLRNLHRDGN